VTGLLALALAAAPGCPGALAEAGALAAEGGAPGRAGARAREIVDSLEAVGAGGPVDAVRRAAGAVGDPASPGPGDPGAIARFRRTLERHCALAAAPAGPGASAADRAALAAILARPEYARGAGDPDALRRMVLRLWADLLELLGTSEAERYARTGRALFLSAAAAALGLAALALRRRDRASPRRPAPPPAVRGEGAREATLAEAAEALARGDATGAVRASFLAALAALERTGRVRGGRTMTNGEIVAALGAAATRAPATPAAAAALASDLAALARLFDRAVYGRLPVAPEDARAALDCARSVARRAEPVA
jgi:hypothetical protein